QIGVLSSWRWENSGSDVQERLLATHPGGVPQIQTLLAACRRQAETYEEYEVPPKPLASITARTLIIFGDRDGFNPVELAVEAYRAIPNAVLWVVPGEGHGPPWSSERVGAMFPGVVHAFFEGTLNE
ncbi:MAG: alpha/beta hydrolase, partial [Anaerolineae bacterium]|nr:alpha/beta hydrolase [Anaerolineae bacterium]